MQFRLFGQTRTPVGRDLGEVQLSPTLPFSLQLRTPPA